MGLLVDGRWQDQWYETKAHDGRFVRPASAFRAWVMADCRSAYPADAGRYHLYVSLACPWAHRTIIFRKLKGLEDTISLSIVDPHMGAQGWRFGNAPGCIPDTVNGFDYLHQVYTLARRDYTGRVTVPVLFDKHTRTIVNNESAEIIEMLNSAFDAFGDAGLDFFPAALRTEMDALNAEIYECVNNGVYRAGFATSQEAYEEAFDALFTTLDKVDAHLAQRRYLLGTRITAADWRLFTTLLRFDAVYYSHFKCNLRRVGDYLHLSEYVRDLYQVPGVASTVNMAHIKIHYYRSHPTINPSGIVPKGPLLDFGAPHGRAHLSSMR